MLPNNNYLFSLDEETAAIIKQVPKRERSAFVRNAVKSTAIVKESPKQEDIPVVKGAWRK